MKTFIVHGKNESGEMARLTDALATKNVNVLISTLGIDGRGVAGFVASDETVAETAVKEAGFEYKMFPALTVGLADKPGMAAEISRKLGDQGVNIECFLPIAWTENKVIAAIGVDDLDVARKALDDYLVEHDYS